MKVWCAECEVAMDREDEKKKLGVGAGSRVYPVQRFRCGECGTAAFTNNEAGLFDEKRRLFDEVMEVRQRVPVSEKKLDTEEGGDDG